MTYELNALQVFTVFLAGVFFGVVLVRIMDWAIARLFRYVRRRRVRQMNLDPEVEALALQGRYDEASREMNRRHVESLEQLRSLEPPTPTIH
ncbi:MAG: hypothetical protein CMH57_02025 [Myxococcales bacterium]|nr:hypothetical protein [Myxococcales bacterium]